MVRDGFEVTVLDIPGRAVEGTKLECLWVRVRIGSRRVTVCSLYRPPVQTSARVAAGIDELERRGSDTGQVAAPGEWVRTYGGSVRLRTESLERLEQQAGGLQSAQRAVDNAYSFV
ncbi:hypothetical protein FJT64_011475 [Amphibalanus amphitrite]|uniref:Uncharacterized protein n=1 Tax=Amphibalanus amphitrite TaxID=1232801 RepID=A0A6A4VFA7_AMPAM|nr:hypothetical protein FJT64_011475 [Amphibalanus amphitrite]